jgi:hypothetical protein
MALGTRDTTSLVTLTGWDAPELRKFALADGTTYDQVVAQINIAMGALNAELYNNPLYGTLASYTDQPDIEYNMGASAGMELHTEYGMPDNQRAITEGHMLPLQKWDRGLGWTWDYLKDARLNQIQADIALGIQDIRDRWRVQLFTRLLKRGDDSGAANGLGTSGLSARALPPQPAARALTLRPRHSAARLSAARMSIMSPLPAAHSQRRYSRTFAPNCANTATWPPTMC